jgi:polyisoprenyl-teichoic acid--peptidoglycan teichoic acid transferase
VRLLEQGDRPSPRRREEARYLDRDEIDRLLAELSDGFRPVAAVCAFAGLRVSEALALRWQDVDFAAGMLHVPGTKTAASKQPVPMTSDLVAELRAHRDRHPGLGEALVFRTDDGKPRTRHAVANAVRVAGNAAKLNPPGVKRVAPHDLRHSCAGLLFAAGVPVPKISATLRHTSPRITLSLCRSGRVAALGAARRPGGGAALSQAAEPNFGRLREWASGLPEEARVSRGSRRGSLRRDAPCTSGASVLAVGRSGDGPTPRPCTGGNPRPACTVGTVNLRMAASGEKPYRVYRGGRTKGKVPLDRRQRERDERRAVRRSDGRGPSRIVERKRRGWLGWTWRRWTLVAILGLIVLFLAWGVAGYLSVSRGVSDANARLPKNVTPVLTSDSGLLFSSPTTILLLGSDHATGRGGQGRSADQHSDSITLLHTDPGRHRLVYLSIPRDLRVTIPGHGTDKINAAMQEGGTKLAIQTIDDLVGKALPVNHVVIVDFNQFEKLIDAVGGITVNVPENILSNRFDCPYPTAARCSQWQGWRFHKGPTHLTGHEALILSRVRENRLDPSWTDFDRQHVQQLVEQATLSKLSSPSLFFSLPFNGSSLLKPIATDLSTWKLMQLAWVKFRAGHTMHCRLGGTSENIGGGDYIVGNEQNIQVIDEVLGNSAPQPPPKGGLYAPGCVVGNGSFR